MAPVVVSASRREKRIGVGALVMRSAFSPGSPGATTAVRRQLLLATLLSAVMVTAVSPASSAYAQNAVAAQAFPDCGPVTDTIYLSPDGAKTVHLMNQYCGYGFGAVQYPFWVVLGNAVAKAGQEDRVDQFGPEDHVVFKTFSFGPVVSWTDEKSLVITVEDISPIQKSLHSLDDIRIKYKISEKLSREEYLGRLRDTEPLVLFNRHLEIFQKWAKENAE